MFVFGICGGSGSGKSTLVDALCAALGPSALALSFDSYYRELRGLPLDVRARTNFDEPASLDVDLYVAHVDALRRGEVIDAPIYDFSHHARVGSRRLGPCAVLVLEGILLFALPAIRERVDCAVFLDVEEATRLDRRLLRDVLERGRDESSVRRQFRETVAPMHDRWVAPAARIADVVVRAPWDPQTVARELAERVPRTLR
jgi:uridine kinase